MPVFECVCVCVCILTATLFDDASGETAQLIAAAFQVGTSGSRDTKSIGSACAALRRVTQKKTTRAHNLESAIPILPVL